MALLGAAQLYRPLEARVRLVAQDIRGTTVTRPIAGSTAYAEIILTDSLTGLPVTNATVQLTLTRQSTGAVSLSGALVPHQGAGVYRALLAVSAFPAPSEPYTASWHVTTGAPTNYDVTFTTIVTPAAS